MEGEGVGYFVVMGQSWCKSPSGLMAPEPALTCVSIPDGLERCYTGEGRSLLCFAAPVLWVEPFCPMGSAFLASGRGGTYLRKIPALLSLDIFLFLCCHFQRPLRACLGTPSIRPLLRQTLHDRSDLSPFLCLDWVPPSSGMWLVSSYLKVRGVRCPWAVMFEVQECLQTHSKIGSECASQCTHTPPTTSYLPGLFNVACEISAQETPITQCDCSDHRHSGAELLRC